MKSNEIKSVIHAALDAGGNRINIYLWGPPGVGKSATVNQVADEAGVDLVDIRASQLDPTDIRGIPIPKDGLAVWLPPNMLPMDPNWKGIIFLDELNLASILVQSSCYQLIWDRRIGNYLLPRGALVVAAGNRAEDGAPAHKMAAPLRNRFTHIVYEADIKEWNLWAMQNGINPDIIAFINFKNDVFCPPFNAKVQDNAFPSPRSWEFVSRVLSAYPPSLHPELVAGCVGKGAQAEFTAYQRAKEDMPDPNEILAGKYPSAKKMEAMAGKADVLYALMTTLAVKAQATQYKNLFGFITHLEKNDGVIEFVVLLLKLLGAKDEKGIHIPEYWKWIEKNKEIFGNFK